LDYKEYRLRARSLDIVLFGGKGRISQAIKWATGSDKSHIALTLHMHEWNCLALFESTTLSDVPDLISGTATKGVQLVNMSSRLKSYDGDVWVRQIMGPRTRKIKRAAMNLMRDFHGRPYEKSQLDLIRSALDIPGLKMTHNQGDASSVFCSELAAIMLREVGIMKSGGEPADEFTPADFAGDGLDLEEGYSLGDIEPLERPS
jgi:hypothetical protein